MATATVKIVETKTVHLSLTLEEAEELKHLLYSRVTNSPEELTAIDAALGNAGVRSNNSGYFTSDYVHYETKK